MKKELGLQLFTIRDHMGTEEEVRASFRKMRECGYTLAQTGGCAISYEAFGRIAKEEGIKIVGTHDDFDMMVNDFDRALELHKQLDTTNMGIGGLWIFTIPEIEDFIRKANIVAKKAAAHGMKFTYHNHNHEFCKMENGKTILEMLVEGLDPENTSFVLDTCWVQQGGGDVRAWIEKLAGRIDILHLKDVKWVRPEGTESPLQITEIGNGNLEWKLILESAEKAGVKYYVVEQDGNFEKDCFTSIKTSADYLMPLL